ncbi:MAG: hypothetical protein SNJ29_16420 [Rikenellaceae bacterium]
MEKLRTKKSVFQTDSDIVNDVYFNQSNYLVEYDDKCSSTEYCAIYFCSNDIYYPNREDIFRKRIVEKNFFEWYGSRVAKAHKHIFIRDIFKQWYLSGINSTINDPEKLEAFLKEATKGYKTIMVGSSAGGYAAILYGSLLHASRVIAFNPQFEINSLLKKSNETIDPLLFRLRDSSVSKYYDIVPIINSAVPIYYIYSDSSPWDASQKKHVGELDNLYEIPFNSKHHGIPFLKVALNVVLNLTEKDFIKYQNNRQNPIIFTIKMVGVIETFTGLIKQLYKSYKKRH